MSERERKSRSAGCGAPGGVLNAAVHRWRGLAAAGDELEIADQASISRYVVSAVAVPQGPAWASWNSVKAAIAPCRNSAAGRK